MTAYSLTGTVEQISRGAGYGVDSNDTGTMLTVLGSFEPVPGAGSRGFSVEVRVNSIDSSLGYGDTVSVSVSDPT